jgi:ribosome-associated protein
MDQATLLDEITFQATRSGGPGGQHANKTSTKVELHWSLEESQALTPAEKDRLRETLANKLTNDGRLVLSSGHTRSQAQNKALVTEKFLRLLEKRVQPPQRRKKTRPSYAAKRRRLENKRRQAEKKKYRRKPKLPPR